MRPCNLGGTCAQPGTSSESVGQSEQVSGDGRPEQSEAHLSEGNSYLLCFILLLLLQCVRQIDQFIHRLHLCADTPMPSFTTRWQQLHARRVCLLTCRFRCFRYIPQALQKASSSRPKRRDTVLLCISDLSAETQAQAAVAPITR